MSRGRERPTHLVISQSDQDDVRRVNPDLEENKTERRLLRVIQRRHTALCDPLSNTHGQLSPYNKPTQHYAGGFPLCVCVRMVMTGRSYLFPEFSSDVAKPLGSIEAHGLQTSVPQHFNHLSIFWKTRDSRATIVNRKS